MAPSRRPTIFKRIRSEIGEIRLLQVCTFGSEKTRSVVQSSCRGYRSEEYPEGIDSDISLYISSLIPSERGFLWSISDVVNGDEEKGRRPVKTFIQEVSKYPGLLDIMVKVEDTVCQRSIHASGVIIYNEDPWKTNAIMRSPDGSLTTQFSLHDSEYLGDVKYDMLLTDVSDKIINCLQLLIRDNLVEKASIRDVYNKVIHPEIVDQNNMRAWDALASGEVLDVFQFNSDVGLQAAKQIHPTTMIEMTMANALTRLMAEKGEERALDRYERMKKDIGEWYKEMDRVGLGKDEQKMLEKYYLPRYATPALQEDLMTVVMDPAISNFTLKESNAARKTVAKKKMSEIPELKKKFVSQCPNHILGEYVWATVMAPQMG